jgi:UDP-glucose 4-epimerase
MRALITGGAGFIGSHLAERLLETGHEVIILDDLSTGSMENIIHIKDHPNCEYRIDSIFNRHLLAELVDLADVVFHLAAAVGVRRIVESPVQTIATNVGGSEIILELSAKKRKRVIITSTSEVYGKSTKLPFSENDDLVLGPTCNCRWSYACSKAIDEFLALAYYRERKLPVTVFRLFNTAGPRQTGYYGMVVPTFVSQALAGDPITVFGTGEQSRCFSYVQDIVSGILAGTACDEAVGQVFNLGGTEETTINELAQRIREQTKSSSTIVHIPYSKAYESGFEDMERRVPDINKARTMFGFCHSRSLDEIIESVVAHFRSRQRRDRIQPAVLSRV